MVEPIKLFAACAYATLLFGVLIKSVFAKYKITNWRGCPDTNERYLAITGISIAACVHECKTRPICKSVGYRRLLHLCDIFSTEHRPSEILENFGTNQCKFIHRKDIEEDKIACNCSPGQVRKKDGSCSVEECYPYTSNTNDVKVSGNQNHVGAKVKLNCGNEGKGSSAECKKNGNWSLELQCTESSTTSSITSSTTPSTTPSTSSTTPSTTSSTAPSTTPSTTSSTAPSTTPSTTSSTTPSTTPSTTSSTTPSATTRTSSTTSTSTPSTQPSTKCESPNNENSSIYQIDDPSFKIQIFTEKKNYWEAHECCKPGRLVRLDTNKTRTEVIRILSSNQGISCPKPIPHGGEIGVVNDFIRLNNSNYWTEGFENGSEMVFSNNVTMPLVDTWWHPAQLGNLNGKKIMCANIQYKHSFRWKAKQCTENNPYICEISS